VHTELDVADLLYHCVRKLGMLGALQLVDERELRDHLVGLSTEILERCSGNDRARLEELLPRLQQEIQHFFAPVAGLRHYTAGGVSQPGQVATGGPEGELARATRRLSLLLTNLRSAQAQEGEAERGRRDQLLAHLVATVAETARDPRELDRYVRELSRVGVADSSLRGLLRTLSAGLPDWTLAGKPGAEAPSKKAGAMQRLLVLKGGSAEPGEWLPEVLRLAIDHFNAGAAGRAVTLLDVAMRTAAERKVDRQMLDRMLQTSWQAVDRQRLRDAAVRNESQPVLQQFLAFFPDAAPEGLLRALETAENQEQRHLCVAMLRAHGSAGREAARRLLEEVARSGVDSSNRETARNALYLLRTVPGDITADEHHQVMLLCSPTTPAPVLREAIEYLSGWRVASAESVLMGLMQSLDHELAHPERSKRPADEINLLLNTVTKALLRFDTASARKVVVDACLQQTAYRREALARLADLGLHDLRDDPEVVARLVRELKHELPPRILRRFVRRDEESVSSLVMALGGTPSPEAAASLEEVVAAFPGRPVAVAAREALERLRTLGTAGDAPATPPPSFGGDLELFGLPTLLQNIEQNEMTGKLTVRDRAGAERVVMLFEAGRLAACQNQGLDGATAFYQLIENPFPGSFEFTRLPQVGAGEVWGVLPLLLEGMRRHDELQSARAMVPEGARLRLTGIAPTAGPSEMDGAFVRDVWNQVKAGAAVAEIARAIGCDDFRAFSLVTHWVEEGALLPENEQAA
jgi:hypothetical protein